MRNWRVVKKNDMPITRFYVYDPEGGALDEYYAQDERQALNKHLEDNSYDYSDYGPDEEIILHVIPGNILDQYKRSIKKTRVISITRV